MSERKILDGGGSMVLKVTGTRDEAQAYLDRDEPIPFGCYLIDKPLVIRAGRLASGHLWASKNTTLVGTCDPIVDVKD